MFSDFFYVLRREGVPLSITEWMTLMEALDRGLARSSLSGFYYLARAVLIKSESHFDRYDVAFQKFFGSIESSADLVDDALHWVENALPPLELSPEDMERLRNELPHLDLEELKKMLEERLAEQKEEHHGGGKWVGTGGTSPFGHSGFHPSGVRIGGDSRNRSAIKVAGERRYKGYRGDKTLGVRQFEVALRRLRQLTSRLDGPRSELDLDQTIDETCRNAGRLKLVWNRPRRNAVKVLLLMDVGGSMYPYAELCSQLFTAVNRSSHFKDLKTLYFHNCIYDLLYLDHSIDPAKAVKTTDYLKGLGPEYKLIILGDAAMAPSELMAPNGNIYWNVSNEEPGIVWLKRAATLLHRHIWLNPIPAAHWEKTWGAPTIGAIREIFPMYELTVDGLEHAVKSLMVRK